MRSNYVLLIALGAVYLISQTIGGLNHYYLQILMYIGFNVILATSLNLINGFTGQFSLAMPLHGIGAYIAAIVSTYLTTHGWSTEACRLRVLLISLSVLEC